MSTDPLPRGWTRRVRSSVLHAISLAATALTMARANAGCIGPPNSSGRSVLVIDCNRTCYDLCVASIK
jgi:hypothetical protein